ncbi:MAG TPA: type II toxin-antitoxin system VapC family toxin [Streptosporangiaceae bacterium]|nr:type II toxin-antitoxin system VapC family toxin [Streptosporangiaceae bacterium]
MTFLLDTNVVSELRKRHPDPRVLAWYGRVASADLFISALTVGEIRLGIERLRRRDAAQADLLEQWLRGLQEIYADRIVDVDAGVAEQWGRLNVPDPLPVIDGLLAASAITHGCTLVTCNVADVASSGVKLVNPFDPPDDH